MLQAMAVITLSVAMAVVITAHSKDNNLMAAAIGPAATTTGAATERDDYNNDISEVENRVMRITLMAKMKLTALKWPGKATASQAWLSSAALCP